MTTAEPSRGDVWLVDLDPVRGHEQAGRRPCTVISVDLFNHGPSGLILALPITTRDRGIPFHVAVSPPEAGLRERSFIKCEDLRSISKERLVERWGSLSPGTVAKIEDRLRIILGL